MRAGAPRITVVQVQPMCLADLREDWERFFGGEQRQRSGVCPTDNFSRGEPAWRLGSADVKSFQACERPAQMNGFTFRHAATQRDKADSVLRMHFGENPFAVVQQHGDIKWI